MFGKQKAQPKDEFGQPEISDGEMEEEVTTEECSSGPILLGYVHGIAIYGPARRLEPDPSIISEVWK